MKQEVELIEIQDMNNLVNRILSVVIYGKKLKGEIFEIRLNKNGEELTEETKVERINLITDFFKNIDERLSTKEGKEKVKKEISKNFPPENIDTIKLILQTIESLISSRKRNGLVNEEGKIVETKKENQILTFDSYSWRRNYLLQNQIEPLQFEGIQYKEVEEEKDNTYKAGRDKTNQGSVIDILNIIKNIYIKENNKRVRFEQGYEADDYHGLIVEEVLKENNNKNIVIITTDNDQNHLANTNKTLTTNDIGKVVKLNPSSKKENDEKFAQIVGYESLLQKIFEGDSSDNISSALPDYYIDGENIKKGVMGKKGISDTIEKFKKENNISIITKDNIESAKEYIKEIYSKKYREVIVKKQKISRNKKLIQLNPEMYEDISYLLDVKEMNILVEGLPEIMTKPAKGKKIKQKLAHKENILESLVEIVLKVEESDKSVEKLQELIQIKVIKDKMDEQLIQNDYIINLNNVQNKIDKWKNPGISKSEEIKDYSDLIIKKKFSDKDNIQEIEIDGRIIYINSIKSNNYIMECYDKKTGVMIMVTHKTIEKTIEIINRRKNEMFDYLKGYEKSIQKIDFLKKS